MDEMLVNSSIHAQSFFKDFPGNLFLIIGLVVLDFFARAITFKRMESIAIDTCFFSLVHSSYKVVIEDLKYAYSFIVVLLLTIIAIALHKFLDRRFDEQLSDTFQRIADHMRNILKKKPAQLTFVSELLNNRKALATKLLEIDLISDLRIIVKLQKPFKHKIRKDFLRLFDENNHLKGNLKEHELLIESGGWLRLLWFSSLGMLALLSMLIATTKWWTILL